MAVIGAVWRGRDVVLWEVRAVWERVVVKRMREVAERGRGAAERTRGAAGQAIEQAMEEMADGGWASWELAEARRELEMAGRE